MEAVAALPEDLSRTRRERRARLLAAAAPLFQRDGYGATTMERIALEAGVSKATLYKYFADKDQLLLDLVKERYLAPEERLLQDLRRTIQEVVTQIQTPHRTEDLARTLLRLLKASTRRRDDVFFRLMVEIAFANPTLLNTMRRILYAREPGGPFSDTGEPLGDDVAAIVHIVFLAIHGHMLLQDHAFGGEGVTEEQLAAALARMIAATLTGR